MLGVTLNFNARIEEGAQVLSQTVHMLGDEYADLRRRLEVWLIEGAMGHPALQESAAQHASRLRNLPPHNDLGSRMLDVAIAFYDALVGQPAEIVVARARRGSTDHVLIQQNHIPLVLGLLVFVAADVDDAIPRLDAWVTAAHERGSLLVYAPATCFRGLAWLSRGALAEAEADIRDSMWAVDISSQNLGRPFVGAYLANVLMEQGRLDEAAAALDWAGMSDPLPSSGFWYWVLDSRARLLMLQGQVKEGLETMLACGRRFAAHGGQNPAFVAWRSGAALALFSLDRPEEARILAAEELTLARRWGAPRALGRALRVAGLVQGGEEGLALLHQAVEVLAPSPARLEHAKALVELGAALRRSGHRLQSRQYLRRGVELAQICGATPLVKHGFAELRASGARPRHITPSGPDALTPSERRVAELAAAGQSNRDIAQTLFITTNTVEVHLTRIYRKLGITGRAGLTRHFNKS
jgi:DNA-binding CsgD family transcriptional regulator